MADKMDLAGYLAAQARDCEAASATDLARAIAAIAAAAGAIAERVALGPLAPGDRATHGAFAAACLRAALAQAPVRHLSLAGAESVETLGACAIKPDAPEVSALTAGGPDREDRQGEQARSAGARGGDGLSEAFAEDLGGDASDRTGEGPGMRAPAAMFDVAADPLHGDYPLDAAIPFGVFFSLYPVDPRSCGAAPFNLPLSKQCAAGYVLCGPHAALMLSVGKGVALFGWDRARRSFRLAQPQLEIAPNADAFAIDASNHRHWPAPIRVFIEDCLEGAEGPRGRNFTMRWVGSLAAEAHRILRRGGVYLAPADDREGAALSLNLLHHAGPLAYLAEQAGGSATDGARRLLDATPARLDQRSALIFGAREKVARIAKYHLDARFGGESPPLFGDRGLYRR
ncbi:MAG: class 1 fructose-bisphosphatase [Pseudomonadota bacterium]